MLILRYCLVHLKKTSVKMSRTTSKKQRFCNFGPQLYQVYKTTRSENDLRLETFTVSHYHVLVMPLWIWLNLTPSFSHCWRMYG